jgi:Membrane protein implicated in regulation of membrane protease activity
MSGYKKRTSSDSSRHKTNIDALVGRLAYVTQTIEQHGTGYVKINGREWMARSTNGARIEKGSQVDIIAIRGAHVIACEHLNPTA